MKKGAVGILKCIKDKDCWLDGDRNGLMGRNVIKKYVKISEGESTWWGF